VQDISAARQADGGSAAEESPSLVSAIVRERWVVLACVVIAALLGIGLSTLQSSKYTTESTIFISAQGDFQPTVDNSQPTNDVARYMANQAKVIVTNDVLNEAIKDAKITGVDAAGLRDEIAVTTSEDASVMTVSVTDSSAQGAKNIADGVVAAYQKVRTQQVKAQVTQVSSADNINVTDIRNITAAAAVYGNGVGSVEPADLPTSASSPQPIRNALILALIGLIAGTGYALYTQSFSRRKVGPIEAGAIFGAPILSEVPDRGRISAEDAIAAAYSEPGDAYRMAAVGLDYIRGTAPGVFLITAPHDGAGSSLTALNLAAAAADHGRRVFLLNIEDTVRPQIDDQGSVRVPLHDLAQGRIDLGHAVERKAASRAQFGIIRLQVLQPVQGHPVPDVQAILDQLPDDTDLVLLDAPPLPASSASFVLAGQVDAAVVVMDEATTPADVEELQRRCRLAGIPVAGVLVNHIRRPNTNNSRRRQRAVMSSVPGRAYDTSPRGLPILNTGGNDGGFPALGGDGRDRGYGGQGGYEQGGSYGGSGGGARPDNAGLPWEDAPPRADSGGRSSSRRR
jgi:capsular polysaccharide biosynthesis protein/Mrp family chromosome partitioning ATPase